MAKVLVVEDHPANMKLAVLLVQKAGHQAISAMDAEEGIAAARREIPDLILMDIQLPGMDGIAATGILRQDPATRDIKILAVTSFAMKGDEEKILASGFDGYIAKPINLDNFMQTVKATLGDS
jgi:two-component system cell cycle response regulator DivK